MDLIDLTKNEEQLKRTVERARERNIIIPTFEEQKNPSLVPNKIKEELKDIGLWDVHPRNLFRITWKNEPIEKGGGFRNMPNYVELPHELTGVEARIIVMLGKYFPTGAHKVGATFGCLVPRLVTGQFDPTFHKAVWPSTGNYCRGGAYDAALLACESIAILPEEMSKERFEWLKTVAGEIIATPGSESNVKEIYDKCHELEATRHNIMIFNQFAEFGNHLWHYEVTGNAMKEVLNKELGSSELFGCTSTTGSAGTIGFGDFLKDNYGANVKVAAGEALQCPTLLMNGYGAHRIEGIGDKHVPWIHNVRNTDMVIAIDDQDTINLIRLFNEPEGHKYLKELGVSDEFIDFLPVLGISSIANILMCIKMAKYYDLSSKDVLITVSTDSMDLYQSRLRELHDAHGQYSRTDAAVDYHRSLKELRTDSMLDCTYMDRKRIHHLKYYTWIEQQGKTLEELDKQWFDYRDYWGGIHKITPAIDKLIKEFNDHVGLL